MFFRKQTLPLLVGSMLVAFVVAACGGAAQPEKVVETVVVEKEVAGETITVVETVEVEKEVVKEVEKIVEVAPDDPDADRVRLDAVIGTEPPSLDPSLATDTTSIFFIRQMFHGLAGFDENANVIPSLATDWSVSDDGLVWTFNLRRGVMCHPSEEVPAYELTAEDVLFSLQKSANPDTSAYAGAYGDMTVEAVDDYTIKIKG